MNELGRLRTLVMIRQQNLWNVSWHYRKTIIYELCLCNFLRLYLDAVVVFNS